MQSEMEVAQKMRVKKELSERNQHFVDEDWGYQAKTDEKHLKIGGYIPYSSVDYPNHLAAVIFLQGCPLKCAYCHNQELQNINRHCSYSSWNQILAHLKKRTGILDAVVFSGGEPLIHSNIKDAITCIKDMGYKVALHTSGLYPSRLKECIPYLDWIGLDIKAKSSAEKKVHQTNIPLFNKAMDSLRIIKESSCDYEVRTTYHPDILSQNDLRNIAKTLVYNQVPQWIIQKYNHFTDSKLPNATIPNSSLEGVTEYCPSLDICIR